jgi:hypothetical protein
VTEREAGPPKGTGPHQELSRQVRTRRNSEDSPGGLLKRQEHGSPPTNAADQPPDGIAWYYEVPEVLSTLWLMWQTPTTADHSGF